MKYRSRHTSNLILITLPIYLRQKEAGILDNNILELIRTFIQSPFFLQYGLVGLFFNGLLSSIIPIPTEITTIALLTGGANYLWVFTVLALGSIIGGFLAYYIGVSGKTVFARLHKKPNKHDEERSHALFIKYGWLAIFLCSWIPILGDIIPIVAGAKQYDFWKFAVVMPAGKLIKIAAIIYFSSFVATTFLR